MSYVIAQEPSAPTGTIINLPDNERHSVAAGDVPSLKTA